MTALMTLTEESPLGADLAGLFARHSADMHAETPPGSVYMLGAADLAAADVRFFVLREADAARRPLAMGALKALDACHAEVKSMHVMREARGRGLSRRMLDHLIACARADGRQRLSLETGREPLFQPAEALYRSAGFVDCGPFGSYSGDPNSLYLTLTL